MREDLKPILITAHISGFLGSMLIIGGDVGLRGEDIGRTILLIGLVLFFLISLPLYLVVYFES